MKQYLIEIAKKDEKINSVAILPSVNISAQYGYTKTESNTSIIIDQTSLGLTGYINFTWDIFDGLARRKVSQNMQIQLESNILELSAIKQEIKKEFKPDRIVNIGDLLDFHAISMLSLIHI